MEESLYIGAGLDMRFLRILNCSSNVYIDANPNEFGYDTHFVNTLLQKLMQISYYLTDESYAELKESDQFKKLRLTFENIEKSCKLRKLFQLLQS